MISLRYIWYDTHKKWREELVVYYGSVFVLLSCSLLINNISRSQSVNKATEQCNLSTNQFNSTLFAFLFTWIPLRVCHYFLSILWREQLKMKERHGAAWGTRRRWILPTLKDRGFNGFHSGVLVHVVNLSQNWLTPVTIIFSAPKLLTELQLSSNFFDGKFPSEIL